MYELTNYLVRAKLYPLHRQVGSQKCARNCCEVCHDVTYNYAFTILVTGESVKVTSIDKTNRSDPKKRENYEKTFSYGTLWLK